MSTADKVLADTAHGAGVAVVFVALCMPAAMLTSFPVKLALGVLHNDVSRAVPALGFWAVVFLLWGGGAAVGHFRTTRKSA
jgi:hypothetical protein